MGNRKPTLYFANIIVPPNFGSEPFEYFYKLHLRCKCRVMKRDTLPRNYGRFSSVRGAVIFAIRNWSSRLEKFRQLWITFLSARVLGLSRRVSDINGSDPARPEVFVRGKIRRTTSTTTKTLSFLFTFVKITNKTESLWETFNTRQEFPLEPFLRAKALAVAILSLTFVNARRSTPLHNNV